MLAGRYAESIGRINNLFVQQHPAPRPLARRVDRQFGQTRSPLRGNLAPEFTPTAGSRARFALDEDIDPYGEHDIGRFTIGGDDCYWKIDYYDRSLEFHSPDSADPSLTIRVLTIMCVDEY